MDRLLSEQEIENVETTKHDPTGHCTAYYRLLLIDIAKAQLAKADKEWVKWGGTMCDKVEHGNSIYQATCATCWQIRTTELRGYE